MAELKICSPADINLQEENIEFDLKEYIFLSLHVFCQRTTIQAGYICLLK